MAAGYDRVADPAAPLGEWLTEAVRDWITRAADGTGPEPTIEVEKLARTVYRVRSVARSSWHSMIVKRLDPEVARCDYLMTHRWLPAIGLTEAAPKLLHAVATPDVHAVWHFYEDLGGVTLKERMSDRDSVTAGVQLIADLHTRGAGHPLLTELRRVGGDFGMHFFDTNVGDALRLLEALRPPTIRLAPEDAAVRDRLRARLEALRRDAERRAGLLAALGGPETMLHGDLWTSNIVLVRSHGHERVRLIDWDHAGTGPFSYDLSTLLYRFTRDARPWVLEQYRTAVAGSGWRIPPAAALNVLCETAETARYANRIVWPAIALLHDGAAWGFPELRAIDQWFEALEPVLDA